MKENGELHLADTVSDMNHPGYNTNASYPLSCHSFKYNTNLRRHTNQESYFIQHSIPLHSTQIYYLRQPLPPPPPPHVFTF